MKKQIFFTVLFFLAALPAGAQLYQPGEVLDYRASYRAKFFPNTEVGSVRVTTAEEEYEGEPMYRIVAHGKTLPAFRWVMNVDDKYTILVDREELKTRRFESDIREGNYRFWSNYVYDWPEMTVHTRWQGRRMVRDTTKTMSLTPRSMDPVSLYFHLRSIDPETLQEGKTEVLEMLLEDTPPKGTRLRTERSSRSGFRTTKTSFLSTSNRRSASAAFRPIFRDITD